MLAVQEELWEVLQNVDAVVYHAGMQNVMFMAEELQIPSFLASPFPLAATSAYPAIIFYGKLRLIGAVGKILNMASHTVFQQIFWMLSRSAAKEFWQRRGKSHKAGVLAPTRKCWQNGLVSFFAYSPLLFPGAEEWSENLVTTGFWTLPEKQDFTPSPELASFLAEGEAPLYIGFGSIKDTSVFQQTLTMIGAALEKVGVRAVLGLGWSSVEENFPLSQNICLIGSVPHQWLFPRVRAVVHHGGAGTTAAGLRAGKATLIIPHLGDQPAWGVRVWELGVGAKPIPKKKLTAEALEAGLREVLLPELRINAENFAAKLNNERGVENAVAVIARFLSPDKIA
ncbi:MAG: glycosyltransferase [Candidatus Kapabacteria bacterium]|jgi:sterol 3beta-glucosyltransferase|nr:glycosyltransferase [Candidatus Kapabacteria bacterium]